MQPDGKILARLLQVLCKIDKVPSVDSEAIDQVTAQATLASFDHWNIAGI